MTGTSVAVVVITINKNVFISGKTIFSDFVILIQDLVVLNLGHVLSFVSAVKPSSDSSLYIDGKLYGQWPRKICHHYSRGVNLVSQPYSAVGLLNTVVLRICSIIYQSAPRVEQSFVRWVLTSPSLSKLCVGFLPRYVNHTTFSMTFPSTSMFGPLIPLRISDIGNIMT